MPPDVVGAVEVVSVERMPVVLDTVVVAFDCDVDAIVVTVAFV